MKKMKVATVLGTRPEIIRLSRVISKLDDCCEHVLIHTGQNYDFELNEVFFRNLEIRKPDYFLNAAGSSAAETIGNVIIKVDELFAKINPEALLVLGDTNSCISVYPAKRRKIPIFHMEAGNRCFDQRVPEETNRRLVDHISDINLTYSNIAREYLLKEGFPADRIIKTGSPMYEVLNHYKKQIESSTILKKLSLEQGKYFVASLHREENVDCPKHLSKINEALNSVAEAYKLPIILSTHPRTRERINKNKIVFNDCVQLIKPLGFFDYNNLQKNSKTTLSDSGTITEESSIMNFPALNLREAHERPEGMEEAAVMMVGLESERILQGLEVINSTKNNNERSTRLVNDYSMPNVSDKVLRVILSYRDYVMRNVWKQY